MQGSVIFTGFVKITCNEAIFSHFRRFFALAAGIVNKFIIFFARKLRTFVIRNILFVRLEIPNRDALRRAAEV